MDTSLTQLKLAALPMYSELQRLIWDKMYDMPESLKVIKDNKLSVSRFGDGENTLIATPYFNTPFQKNSANLSKELKDILINPNHNLIVGQPSPILNESHIRLWSNSFIQLKPLLEKNAHSRFVSTHLSRPLFFKKYDRTAVEMYRELWRGLDITVVTGKGSRFDLIPDMFNTIKSVKYVYTKAVDAYDDIDDLRERLKKDSSDLIILSLGPTATVLASDLSKMGKWAIDLGHVASAYYNVFEGGKMPEQAPIIEGSSKTAIY
ncbi:GT-D fold domain-containing glycosyltransferase [Weissella paramesenteroides]|uniref:Glycosyltransferase GT-D fold domain-containing protein n=1 Tax=Weissella paramesenteroides ATCC 33313 TaxID=585506 RepID=C5RCE2_WEIPA|nr:GT-D fold domain-containing glycosyltransferase [Weissella paramesenteroides]ATF41398.1 DUF1792 domain-containing protein [Weissella paramesenteroides]EER74098.1 hypothetical protein HMPREF0877_1638 [Weissella paramesenteroides ATCC 33313]